MNQVINEDDQLLKAKALEEFKNSLYKLSRRTLRRSISTSRFSSHIKKLQRDTNLK